MSFKLDVGKFKKVHSDENSSTMQHENGHKLIIQHAKLDRKTLGKLKALPMADGGEVADNSNVSKGMKSIRDAFGGQDSKQPSPQPSSDSEPAKKDPNAWTKSHFPFTDKTQYADGGGVNSSPAQEDPLAGIPGAAAAPQPISAAPVAENPNEIFNTRVADETKRLQTFLPGDPALQHPEILENKIAGQMASEVDDRQMAAKGQLAGYNEQVQRIQRENQVRAKAGIAPQSIPQPPQGAEQPQQPQQQSGGIAPPANMPASSREPASGNGSIMGGYADNVKSGYDLESKGIQEEANALKQLGSDQQQVYSEQAQKAKSDAEYMQATQAKSQQEREHFIRDVQNGFIDPKQLMNNMGTGQKVGTALSILISGLGAGAAGTSNMAMDFLNKQIENNIEAQKANLGAKNNLLSNNLENFKNMNDAVKMTHIMYNDMYAHQIDQMKSKSMGPQAQAAADKAKGELMQKNAMILGSMGAGGMGRSSGDPIADRIQMFRLMGNHKMADDLQERYIPGIGLATVKPSAEVRADLVSKQQFHQQVSSMINWVQKHSGTVLDRKTVNEGKAMAAELASAYRQASHGGVYKEGEQDFINKLVPEDPSQFAGAIRTLPKLKELQQNNQGRLSSSIKALGIQGMQGQQSSQSGSFQPKSFQPIK